MSKELIHQDFIERISVLLNNAKIKIINTVNHAMVFTYFEIGRLIIEEEQNGKERADYGKQLLSVRSKKLTIDFGKGFSETNIKQMRSFYTTYSKRQTLSDEFKLSWSHYLKLMRIDDEKERNFYEIESSKNNWSLRELQRQYDTALYTRLSLSRSKDQILQLSIKGQILEKPKDAIKDPYILEFLGLPDEKSYSENELEQKLIDKLEHFLLELGTGFNSLPGKKEYLLMKSISKLIWFFTLEF